jgi:N-acetylneuraminic acid mutarotase
MASRPARRTRRAPRRRPSRARIQLRRLVALALVVVPLAAALLEGPGEADPAVASRTQRVLSLHLAVEHLATLPVPLEDAAAAAAGGGVVVAGGIGADGSSTSAVLVIHGSEVRQRGRLPVALHDAAAASLGAGIDVFGGGQTSSFDAVTHVDAASGRTTPGGSLGVRRSDLAAATIGSTTYLVGGFDGTTFSDAVTAFSGGHARQVATLPSGLRYAAVAAVGDAVLIAGGRTPAGPSRDVWRYQPGSGRLTHVGLLPTPLMHAAAGVLGDTMYVVGGLGPDGRPTRSVLALSATGHVHVAAQLPTPLSDAAVASLPSEIVVVGGSDGVAPVADVLALRLVRGAPLQSPHVAAGSPLGGDLLIADRGNDRILLVDAAHRVLWRFPRPGQHALHFDDDTFFAPGGRSIVSNQEEDHTIVRIAYPSGRLLWSYGHPGVRGSAPGYLNTPDDAYVLRNGLTIVADAYNCRVLELRGQRIVRSIGQAGVCVHDPPRSLGAINGDTPLPDGHVLISEINGSYIDDMTLDGRLVHVYKAPVTYPSDPQLTRDGNIILADYTRPGGVVILDRATGALLWSYRVASGPGMLDHPSLAAMLPNGNVIVGDDFNDRIAVIDPRSRRIVWQYGHDGLPGTAPGSLHTPDGFDFVPVTASGQPDPAAILHGP